MIKNTMKSIDSHSLSKLVKPVLSPVLNDISKSLDYEEYGGTPILGVNGIVLKCHGLSKTKAIKKALFKAQVSYQNKLIPDLEYSLQKISENLIISMK